MTRTCACRWFAGFIGRISRDLADAADCVVALDMRRSTPRLGPPAGEARGLRRLGITMPRTGTRSDRGHTGCHRPPVAAETGTGQSLTEASRHASVS